MGAPEYRDLLARLSSARRFGMKLGLERMRELLDRLGAPDRALGTVVHVAGTNGKGSTVAIVSALARAAGARVATYTSPHLSSLRERITLGGVPVSEEAIVAAAQRVSAEGGDELTFFEQITAIGFVLIAEARVDVSVIEVGLGGRLDATNVVDAQIGVVTGIAMDHEAILGTTLEAIAREKAGIFKAGQHVVIGASGEREAVPVLLAHARAAGAASITLIDDAAIGRVPPLGLAGAHQRANAAAALAAVDKLEELGAVRPIERGATLAKITHPGRFERAGDVILDGAHNPAGARALANTLREQNERPVLVMAMSSDKDVRAIVEALAPVVRAVICTRYQQERALDPRQLAAVWTELTPAPVETAIDLAAAMARARVYRSTILVAGSLFLVGEARVMLLGAPADPVLLSDPVGPSSAAPAGSGSPPPTTSGGRRS